jgi:hypothetical protein
LSDGKGEAHEEESQKERNVHRKILLTGRLLWLEILKIIADLATNQKELESFLKVYPFAGCPLFVIRSKNISDQLSFFSIKGRRLNPRLSPWPSPD